MTNTAMELLPFILTSCLAFMYPIMCLTTYSQDRYCTTDKRCICLRNTENLLVANCSNVGLTDVPKFNKTVRIVDLSKNYILSVPTNGTIPFDIMYINLSRNSLQYFNNGALKEMFNLTWLDISHNNLRYDSNVFTKNVFDDLKRLKFLNIKHNADVKKSVDSYPTSIGNLPALEQLLIDGLDNVRFGKGFLKLKRLTQLDLSGSTGYCTLRGLHTDYFKNLPYLKYVNLSHCHLRSIESGTFINLTYLGTLDLSYNARLTFRILENITYDIQFTNLTVLSLKKIHCTYGIGTTLFEKDMKYLRNSSVQELHLDSNRLETVEYTVMRYLPRNLRFFSVSDNKFILGKYLLLTELVRNLEILDVSNQYQSHGMTYDVFEECNDWRGPENFNENNSNDKSKIVNHYTNQVNLVNEWGFFKFPLPPKLRIANAMSSSFKGIIGNFNFLSNNSLTHLYLQYNMLHTWRGPIRNLHHLEYLDLSYNQCNNVTKFVFDDLLSLKVLNISNNNLGSVLFHDVAGETFKKLQNVSHLDLSNNRITRLSHLVFKNMRNLSTLKLHSNLLATWNVSISHMNKLKSLDISYNQISVLSKEQRTAIDSLRSINNFTINMTGNTLNCICESLDFLNWLDHNKKLFYNFDSYGCSLYNGTLVEMKHLPAVLTNLGKHCHSYFALIGGVLVAVVLSFSVVICGLVYRYRWKLRYLYYATKSKYKGVSDSKTNSGASEYDYHAFVSYADEDQNFIIELVTRHIEQNADLRLCLHQRDFIAGNAIAENITEAVRRSKRTIVILSPHYLKSYWCMFEFNMARMESIYKRNGQNVLFLVFYKKVATRDIPLNLLDLIENESYLEYPADEQSQIVFWKKLENAISTEE